MTHEEIIKDMNTLIAYFQQEGGATPICMEEAIAIIRGLDAAPAGIKTGEWLYEYNTEANAGLRARYRCSICGRWQTYGKPPYCMNCGSSMINGRGHCD